MFCPQIFILLFNNETYKVQCLLTLKQHEISKKREADVVQANAEKAIKI